MPPGTGEDRMHPDARLSIMIPLRFAAPNGAARKLLNSRRVRPYSGVVVATGIDRAAAAFRREAARRG